MGMKMTAMTPTTASILAMSTASGVTGAVTTREDRVACIVGRPGVGKTRLVLEALVDAAVKHRVRVAKSVEEAERAIDSQRLLQRHPDLVLVVDDCLVREARDIATSFRAAVREESRARVVLLVPASFDAVRADQPWAVLEAACSDMPERHAVRCL